MNYAALKVGSWDLSSLVKNPAGDEFRQYLASIENSIRVFEARRQNLRSDMPPAEFEGMIREIEDISERLSVAAGFAYLGYYANTASNEASALVTRMDKMAADAANRLLFFDLWFKKQVDDTNAARLIQGVSPAYREHLRHERLLAKYSLSEPEEKIINTLEVTGIGALVKIYDKMTSAFEFQMKLRRGKKVVIRNFDNREKLASLVRSADPAEREAAYKAIFAVYKKNSGVLGEIYQNIVVEWRDEALSMRGYKTPISVRNIGNDLDDATADALLAACRKNSPIFHEYFREKAKMLGTKKLHRYDLYAPMSTKRSGKKFAYGKAVSTVLDTFGSFDPKVRSLAERVFQERHVDSEIRKAKRGGAFCHTVSPKITPYVLLNYDGRTRDVSTIAHEFGHAIHSMLAQNLPPTVAHAPLPLAETASVLQRCSLTSV